MGKIDEFERKIIEQGMTDEDFIEYEKMLKRIRDNFSKRQHCYTTAIQLPEKYSEQAVKLIQYGLDNFEDGWFSTYTSYLYMGHIYERIRNYQKAYESYLLAKESLITSRRLPLFAPVLISTSLPLRAAHSAASRAGPR